MEKNNQVHKGLFIVSERTEKKKFDEFIILQKRFLRECIGGVNTIRIDELFTIRIPFKKIFIYSFEELGEETVSFLKALDYAQKIADSVEFVHNPFDKEPLVSGTPIFERTINAMRWGWKWREDWRINKMKSAKKVHRGGGKKIKDSINRKAIDLYRVQGLPAPYVAKQLKISTSYIYKLPKTIAEYEAQLNGGN